MHFSSRQVCLSLPACRSPFGLQQRPWVPTMGWEHGDRMAHARALRKAARKCGLPRDAWLSVRATASRAALSALVSKKSIYRKGGEGSDSRFHGRRGTEYKQGRRVGVWGVLTSEGLSVAFLAAGRINGEAHAALVRRYYRSWAGECQAVFHDGEKALHGPAPKAAYQKVGVACATFPPYSPDLNPIENVWAMLDTRLEATQPRRWEGEKAFKRRVRNAVTWLNAKRAGALKRTVASMPRRIELLLKGRGAITPY